MNSLLESVLVEQTETHGEIPHLSPLLNFLFRFLLLFREGRGDATTLSPYGVAGVTGAKSSYLWAQGSPWMSLYIQLSTQKSEYIA